MALGLLKPGLEDGFSVISVILNKFNSNQDISRSIKVRIFSEEMLLLGENIHIDGHKEINTMDLFPQKLPDSVLWYVS